VTAKAICSRNYLILVSFGIYLLHTLTWRYGQQPPTVIGLTIALNCWISLRTQKKHRLGPGFGGDMISVNFVAPLVAHPRNRKWLESPRFQLDIGRTSPTYDLWLGLQLTNGMRHQVESLLGVQWYYVPQLLSLYPAIRHDFLENPSFTSEFASLYIGDFRYVWWPRREGYFRYIGTRSFWTCLNHWISLQKRPSDKL
jgi:hypothetical protein